MPAAQPMAVRKPATRAARFSLNSRSKRLKRRYSAIQTLASEPISPLTPIMIMIGMTAGGSAMYQAMTGLGFAADSQYGSVRAAHRANG